MCLLKLKWPTTFHAFVRVFKTVCLLPFDKLLFCLKLVVAGCSAPAALALAFWRYSLSWRVIVATFGVGCCDSSLWLIGLHICG